MQHPHIRVGEDSDRYNLSKKLSNILKAQSATINVPRSNILQLGHTPTFVPTYMNLPPQLQQEVEKWASHQAISFEQFILQAVAEKITALNQQNTQATTQISQAFESSTSQQSKIYQKEGILVVETEPIHNLDINAFINELREERIQEQMAW